MQDGLHLSAITDPVGQRVTWSSSNPKVAYFDESGYLHAVSHGTTTITVLMSYNGVTYTDSTLLVLGDDIGQEDPVKPADYTFKIYCNLGDAYNYYGIESNIPGCNGSTVTWSVDPANADWFKDTTGAYVDSSIDCTVSTSFVYNGKTYTGSIKQTAVKKVEYTFRIEKSGSYGEGTELRSVYGINTNIPNFTADNVIWSVEPTTLKGWVEGGQYVVDIDSMALDVYYTLTATYIYDGVSYTDSCGMMKTNNPDNTTWSFHSTTLKGWAESGQYAVDESYILSTSYACDGRTCTASCTSAAVPSTTDRCSRKYAM